MKFIFICGSALVLLFLFLNYAPCEYQSPSYVKRAHRITAQTAKKLEETQRGLRLIGTGGGMMNDIHMMAMSFNYYQEVDLDKARELILAIIDEYLTAINSDESVRPYLHDNPFTTKNIEIRIWVCKPDGSNLPLDSIYYISAMDDAVNYYIKGEEDFREVFCKESYQDAKYRNEEKSG